MAFKEGFYLLFYTGKDGSGSLFLYMKSGKLVGAEPGGGLIRGTYELVDAMVTGRITIDFQPGPLVTGQMINEPVQLATDLNLPVGLFLGETSRVDIGIGPMNVRGEFLAEPI